MHSDRAQAFLAWLAAQGGNLETVSLPSWRGRRRLRSPRSSRLWMRLHEKGGKHHAMLCHHTLEGAGLENDPKARCSAPSAAAPAS